MKRTLVWTVAGALLGWLVAGGFGLLAGIVVALAADRFPPVVLWSAVGAPAVVALATLVEADLDERGIRTFASARPQAHQLGLLMVLVWAAAAVVMWTMSDAPSTVTGSQPGHRRRWPLIPLVVLAVLVTAIVIE